MSQFNYKIIKVSERKLEIFIDTPYSSTREFDITLSENGLRITIDGTLQVLPRATNQIDINYRE